jgi:hypothetical protein
MSDGQHSPHDPAHLLALNAALRAENENLRAIVAALKRTLFGARSEKQVEPEAQLPLALDDLFGTPGNSQTANAGERKPAAAAKGDAQYRRAAAPALLVHVAVMKFA